jgi:hypothetical protein
LHDLKQLTNHKLLAHLKRVERRIPLLQFGEEKEGKKRNPKIETDNLSSLSQLS